MDYEKALTKLINILKLKNSDTITQIEELWDTVNKPNEIDGSSSKCTSTATASKNGHLETALNKSLKSNSATVKRAASDLQSTITTSPQSSIKKKKLQQQTDSGTKQASKLTNGVAKMLINDSFSDNNSNSNSCSSSSKSGERMPKMDVEIKFENCATTNRSKAESDTIDEYVIEMGLTCDICKQLFQEKDNKLIECQDCKNLYHQLCHKPVITSSEIQDPRMLWYCSKCVKSVKKQSSDKEPVNNNNNVKNTKATYKPKESTTTNGSSHGTIKHKSPPINNLNSSAITENSSSQKTLANIPRNDSSDQFQFFKRDPKSTNDKTNESNGASQKALKGFAALATKLSSTSDNN